MSVLATIPDWSSRQIPFVLATVIGVRGSTYRGLGARQLIAADGALVGTVSGGCLDNDLVAIAAATDPEARAQVVEYDLTADDEAIWGWGIGCNGVTQLLIESGPAAEAVAKLIATRPDGVLHTLSGDDLGRHEPVSLYDPAWGSELVEARRHGRHRRITREGTDYLLEVLAGAAQLVVCGAGHDAVPLVRLAGELGFETTVIDDRRAFLTSERFPEADRMIQCAPADLASHVRVDDNTHFVIMSHNYLRDLAYLGALVGLGAAYIGCLGPGERLERMFKDLETRGIVPTDSDPIFGPAGLDLGADGPVEIAWAILSEILAVRRQRAGVFGDQERTRRLEPVTVKIPMQISHEFEVARPLTAVWEQFQDVPTVAQCLPGAALDETKGDNLYAGNISVKLGPIASTFEGEAKVTPDPANHSALIEGKGVDKRGGSRGQVKVTYVLRPGEGSNTHVTIDADVSLAGPAAQFGRTGLINEMSRRLISDFVACLEAKMAAPTAEAAALIEAGEVKPFRLFWSSLASWLKNLLRPRS